MSTTPTKTIVWMSRHFPTRSQREELKRLYPSHTLVMDTNAFSGADDIIRRFKAVGGDELVVVAPLAVVREIARRGIQPLWAEMEQLLPTDSRAEVEINHRHYRFVAFHRVHDVRLDTTNPLTGEPTTTQEITW